MDNVIIMDKLDDISNQTSNINESINTKISDTQSIINAVNNGIKMIPYIENSTTNLLGEIYLAENTTAYTTERNIFTITTPGNYTFKCDRRSYSNATIKLSLLIGAAIHDYVSNGGYEVKYFTGNPSMNIYNYDDSNPDISNGLVPKSIYLMPGLYNIAKHGKNASVATISIYGQYTYKNELELPVVI